MPAIFTMLDFKPAAVIYGWKHEKIEFVILSAILVRGINAQA